MNKKLENKLKELPSTPGVYFHKSASGEIIYVGKAAVLKNRVRQYFQKGRAPDPKTDALVAEIVDTDWITVETELDALFLESEMIKRYKPRYNIMLRDDKSQLYVRINMQDPYPYVSFTRYPFNDGAEYFGPYYNGRAIKRALRFLRKTFPYSTHEIMPKRLCLHYHLGLCPGVEAQKISSQDYKQILRRLIRYLQGDRKKIIKELESEMKQAAKNQQFEEAAKLRNRIYNLRQLQNQIVFRDEEFMDLSKDHALSELVTLLGLPHVPRRIEGYDISHMQGTNNVASMVVATNGIAHKSEYRKFKMRLPGNDDFGHMRETMLRRFSGEHKNWPMPDLVLIDGGKGQVSAALNGMKERGISVPTIGLAKRLETIIVPHKLDNGKREFQEILLPQNSHVIKLLQRIRDESHRFAVSYHTVLKRQRQIASELDAIPGIGPATRRKLMSVFGSTKGVKAATEPQLQQVLGENKGSKVFSWLHQSSQL